MKQYLRMRKSCEIYPSYDLRVIENQLMNPISQKTSVIKQKGNGWSEFWTFNNHIILFTTVNNRKIRYKKSGKYSQPDHRSLRPQPSLSSDTMPVDENERRTKVLKKFAVFMKKSQNVETSKWLNSNVGNDDETVHTVVNAGACATT